MHAAFLYCRLVRQRGYSGLILGLTGHTGPNWQEDVLYFKEHGVNDVLPKPFNIDEFDAATASAMRSSCDSPRPRLLDSESKANTETPTTQTAKSESPPYRKAHKVAPVSSIGDGDSNHPPNHQRNSFHKARKVAPLPMSGDVDSVHTATSGAAANTAAASAAISIRGEGAGGGAGGGGEVIALVSKQGVSVSSTKRGTPAVSAPRKLRLLVVDDSDATR